MEKKISDLSLVEQAWSSALIKTNSTNFKRTGEIGDVEDVRSFSQYLKELGSFATRVDMDRRMDDKLKKYLVMTVDDKENRSDDRKVNLLTDNKGYDIAMIYIRDENVVVEVSPEVLKNNKAFLRQASISNDRSKIEVGDLEELDRVMEPDSVEKIIEQIEKYDSVKIRNRDDARNRIKGLPEKDKERADVGGDLNDGIETEAQEKSEEELAEEAEEAGLSESSDLDTIIKICKENDLSPQDIKQTLTVVDPATIENDSDNRTNVDPNGGMVLMLRFKNKEAGAGPDNVYIIQNGELLPSNAIDNNKMSEIMTQNEGNPQVHELDDDRLEKVLAEITQIKLEYDKQVETIESINAENKQEILAVIADKAKEKIKDCLGKYDPEIDKSAEIEAKESNEIESKTEETAQKIDDDELAAFEVPGKITH